MAAPAALPTAASRWLDLLSPPGSPHCLVGIRHALKTTTTQIWACGARAHAYATAWQGQWRSVFAALHGFDVNALPTWGEEGTAPWSVLATAPNPRARRLSADVTTLRCLPLDIDHGGEDFLQRLELAVACGFPAPSCVVRTSREHYQVLWALYPTPASEQPTYRAAVQALAARFGGDSAVIDVARVFRVPGYSNHKYEDAPVVDLLECTGHRYALAALAQALDVRPAPPRPAPARAPQADHAPWDADALAYRDAQWPGVLAQLPPLEFNAGRSQAQVIRAVMAAGDWGFEESEIPAALGPWLDAAVVHPGPPNPDAEDRAGFAVRLYANTAAARREDWGVKIHEWRHHQGVTAWIDTWAHPAGEATPPPAPPDATTVPLLSVLDGTLDGAARDFLSSHPQPPIADRDGRLHLWDATRGVFRPQDPDVTSRAIVDHLRGREITDPNRPQSSRQWQWKSARQLKDTVEMVLLEAGRHPPTTTGGIGFSDGLTVTVQHGRVAIRPATPADRLGLGMAHYDFPLQAPTATPPPALSALLSGALTPEEIRWLRQWWGACLVGCARRLAVSPVFQGAPATGKSALLNVLRMTMPETIAMNAPGDLDGEYFRAGLHDARLLIMPDNVEATGFRHLKSIISEDVPVQARHPYGRVFSPRLVCGVALATNQRLSLNEDPTDGIWRRLAPLVFRRESIPRGEQRDVVGEIRGELPAVIRWAVGGLVELAGGGWTLPEPATVEQEREQWRRRGNGFLEWWADQESYTTAPAGGPGVPLSRILSEYRQAASEWGGRHLGPRRCEAALRWAVPGITGTGPRAVVPVSGAPAARALGVISGGKKG